tara:strand:+ start:1976 stop:2254 length:279 start_codon:yes stop_codon:yes gene_type:complete
MRYVLMLGIVAICLQGCASYDPLMDTAGRSGTFNEPKATEITNDIQHCKMLADHNSDWFSNIIHWIESPEAETKHTAVYRKCLVNRGHSVLN